MAKTGLESVVKAEKMPPLKPGRHLCQIDLAALLATPRLRNKLIAGPGPARCCAGQVRFKDSICDGDVFAKIAKAA